MKYNPSKFQKLAFWRNGSPRWVNTAGFIFLAVILVGGTAYMLYRGDNQQKKAQIKPTEEIAVMPGWWYKDYFGTSVCEKQDCQADVDFDKDGLTNAQEFYYHSNPLDADTNKNGKSDGEDVANDIDPSKDGDLNFEEAAGQDNIFGESLLFDQDVKQEIIKGLDPNQVKLPLVEDREIKISQAKTNEAAIDYVTGVSRIVTKYFTRDQSAYIEQAIKSKDRDRIEDIKLRAERVQQELMELTVPTDFVTIHKYTLAMFKLIGQVVDVPSEDMLANEYSTMANSWFDSAQALMLLVEKTSREYTRLKGLYGVSI